MTARHVHVAVRKRNVKARAIQHTTEQELEAPWINSVNMGVPSAFFDLNRQDAARENKV
jgi:hypothetical protein